MKYFYLVVIAIVLTAAGAATVCAGEKAPRAVVDLAHGELVNLGTDPVVVKAVKAENAKGKTLEQIRQLDEKWQSTPGVVDFMRAFIDSECGKHLREIQSQTPYLLEIFVMDRQGGLAAATNKTSDYWQGDEAKFKESYRNGAGAVFVDEVEFDESVQAYVVQVSVPVKDGDEVIGAVTIGVDVDQVE